MLIIIFAVITTFMAVYFLITYKKAGKTIAIEIVYSAAWKNKFEMEKLDVKKAKLINDNNKYHKYKEKALLKKIKAIDKERSQYAENVERYSSGNAFTPLDALVMFGYQFLVNWKVDSNNMVYKKLVSDCEQSGYIELEHTEETMGKKNASIYAYYLLGGLVSFIYVGLMIGFIVIVLSILMGNSFGPAMAVGLGVAVGVSLIGYMPYDTIHQIALDRKKTIDREFPDALSKLTLLILAGLNITKALERTVEGSEGLIYRELQLVIDETNRGATFEAAFIRMKSRCSNEYLDKMIALMTKSYKESSEFLADSLILINKDCWLNKKHGARRMSEEVQNKLYIPTMLMFLGILVVIIVPALSAFNGGF
ncbi:MAG: type II secretion system F family protein [Lachnospiraceae bacterium]|nr:type II secretion system F family protein [Lachnospiraceae bacterium]